MDGLHQMQGEDPAVAEARIAENIEEEGLPTADAMLRSENYQLGGQVRPPTVPSISQYKKGGKVKSKKVDITDVVKEVGTMNLYEKAAEKLPFENVEKSTKEDLELRAENMRYGKIPKLAKKALKGKKK